MKTLWQEVKQLSDTNRWLFKLAVFNGVTNIFLISNVLRHW